MTTPFTTYAFPASSEPTNRTMPDRLVDYHNIKDFGAVGNNVTDDWLAIQNTIEWNSIDLLAAADSPGIPLNAVRATLTATVSGGQVTALTIGNVGDNYVPGQVYTITIVAVPATGGTGATATATATAGGLINQASLAITAPGSGYTVPPTCTIEYPGHVTTLTFTTMVNLIQLVYTAGVVDVGHNGIIPQGTIVTAVNVGAKTATLRGLQEFGTDTSCVRGAGVVSGVTQIRFLKTEQGLIVIPPGTYRVSRPVELAGNGSLNTQLRGAGRISKFVGNFNDYVLSRGINNTSSASGSNCVIEKVSVENEHVTGGGLRFGMVAGGSLRDIDVTANRCISTYNQDNLVNTGAWGSFELVIENCRVTPGSGRRTGSFGIATQADGPITNCVVRDLAKGIICCGGQGGTEIQGNRIELCDIGYQPGIMPSGENASFSNWSVLGTYFKNNATAIRNTGSNSAVQGVAIRAETNSAPGGINADYGIRVAGANGQRCLVSGVNIGGSYNVGGVYIDGGEANRTNATWMAVNCINDIANGTTIFSWRMPATAITAIFIENNCPAPVFTFANLPTNVGSNRREGDEFNISNNNGVAWGVAAAAGGSTHALVRVNQALAYVVEGI